MSYPFGITGIGYNPYMSGLGMYGLPNSTYSSYYNPAFMGYDGMGMMGMYPTYMKQMNQAYQDIEKNQLSHSGAMHDLLLENRTNAYKAEDMALFKKAMEDASLNGLIVNLAEKIREGDADGICEEFDKLKGSIYQKYNTYLKANSNRLDPTESVNNIIEGMYAQIISKKTGEQVSLRSDIKKYGESAFMHGFNEKFFGKKDYHDKYTEETLSYLFGTRIDNKGGKDRMESIGGGVAKVAEGVTAAAAGYGAGIGLAALGKILNPLGICENLGLKGTHKFGKWAALAALGADIVWQLSRD